MDELWAPLQKTWTFILNADNRETLAWLGTSSLALAAAVGGIFKLARKLGKTSSQGTQEGDLGRITVAANSGIAVGGSLSARDVTISDHVPLADATEQPENARAAKRFR